MKPVVGYCHNSSYSLDGDADRAERWVIPQNVLYYSISYSPKWFNVIMNYLFMVRRNTAMQTIMLQMLVGTERTLMYHFKSLLEPNLWLFVEFQSNLLKTIPLK